MAMMQSWRTRRCGGRLGRAWLLTDFAAYSGIRLRRLPYRRDSLPTGR
jgi:hypothetical protein